MKKTSILFAALSFAALASCSKVENAEPAQNGTETIHVTLTADAPDAPSEEGATKVGIEGDRNTGFRTFWEEGDEVTLRYYVFYESGTAKTTGYSPLKLTSVDADGKATFSGDIAKEYDGSYQYIREISAIYNYTPGYELPSLQTMNGNDFDKKAIVMYSREIGSKWLDKNVRTLTFDNFNFVHVCTFLNIYVKELSSETVSGDEIVKTVTVTAPNKWIAGKYFYFKATDSNLKDGFPLDMRENASTNYITVTVPEGTKLKDLSAKLVAAPFELSNEPLTIAIDTDKHSLKKTVNLTRKFSAARMSTIGFKIDNSFDEKPYIKAKQTDLTFSYLGETRTFDIDANVSWSVDTESLPEGVTVEKDGDALKVTIPISSHFGDKKFPVRLVGTGISTTVGFVQHSHWEVNEGCKVNEDGTLLVGVGSAVPQLTLKEKTKKFGFTFDIKDSKGFSSATSPMINTKAVVVFPTSGGKETVEYRIGGGDNGNGMYHDGKLIDLNGNAGSFKRKVEASDFNKLSSFRVGLYSYTSANSSVIDIETLCTVNFTDDNLNIYKNNFDTGISWFSSNKDIMTVTLTDRGNGSFVISSYKAEILDLNE